MIRRIIGIAAIVAGMAIPAHHRYTVVNGRTVLVEPRSRRIVELVE